LKQSAHFARRGNPTRQSRRRGTVATMPRIPATLCVRCSRPTPLGRARGFAAIEKFRKTASIGRGASARTRAECAPQRSQSSTSVFGVKQHAIIDGASARDAPMLYAPRAAQLRRSASSERHFMAMMRHAGIGPSALIVFSGSFPVALPQAGIGRHRWRGGTARHAGFRDEGGCLRGKAPYSLQPRPAA
jgi:hypothetical protein